MSNYKRTLLGVIIVMATNIHLYAQMDKYSIIGQRPVSPTAFEFVKYTEVPVSEYTGLPNISVPLYTIAVDEVKIPIALSYHAQGIRVSQEASWVGLGWDFQVGSVIQNVQDRDDYSQENIGGQPIVKQKPDWFYSNGDGQPRMLPMRYKRPTLYDGDGWMTPFPISTPSLSSLQQGFAVAIDSYIPVNGGFNVQQWALLNERWYDSEPDIFNASFPGGNLRFILDFGNSYALKILNKKGYKASSTTNGFVITNPEGTKFYFELKSPSTLYSYSNNIDGYSAPTPYEAATNIFFLTRIVTKNKEYIDFEYSGSTNVNSSYPQYSDKLVALTDQQDLLVQRPTGTTMFENVHNDGSYAPWQGVLSSYSVTQEKYYYLKSISFPGGKVEFQTSERLDVSGAKKLDKVFLRTPDSSLVRQWDLSYSYYDASGVNGNGYVNTNGSSLAADPRSSLRLKLNKVQEVNGGAHSFIYNTTTLPKKNSFAQDYWGYYNGVLTNTSLAPNPSTLGFTGFVSNSNNRNANLAYAKAGLLEEMIYPTGGKVQFEYELNQFDKAQMQGFPSTTPQYVAGAGLRIKSIKSYADLVTVSKKVQYTYEGGKLISPRMLYRQLPYSQYMGLTHGNSYVMRREYMYKELASNGFFASNPLGSINGVGYNQVTRKEEGSGGATLGKTVSTFYNTPDIHNPTIALRALYCALPMVKLRGVENGSIQSVKLYDAADRLMRNSEYTYSLSGSELYYGARIFPYESKLYIGLSEGVFSKYTIKQHLVGYYPIHDYTSLLTKVVTTDYDDANQSSVSESGWGYDWTDRPANKYERGSDGEYFYHQYVYPDTGPLVAAHRTLDPSSITKIKRTSGYVPISDSRESFEYTAVGDRYLLKAITRHPTLKANAISDITEVTLFDINTGKPLEYIDRKSGAANAYGTRTSLLWDYTGQYMVAEIKNASASQVAYTSFETNYSGKWSYNNSSVSDPTAPTGNKVYSLSSGTVTWSSQIPGIFSVSYWKKNGAVQVNGQAGLLVKTVGGWSYYEHKINLLSPGNITITGTAYIDEARLCPADAVMSTYTYKPLIGMTTSTDAAGKISYYEYDAANRLRLIRDQDRNIVKKICYNYAGEVENCEAVLYKNLPQSGSFSRNNCGIGYTGRNVTYTVPANTYSSTISQAEANALALSDVNANGQNYANLQGSCSPSTVYAKLTYENMTYPWYYSYADIIVRFYADAACTIPVTATNLEINYEMNVYSSGGAQCNQPYTNYSYAHGTTALVLEYYAEIDDFGQSNGYCNYNYRLMPGWGYTIIN